MRRIDSQHSIPVPHTLPDHRILHPLMELANNSEIEYAKFCEAAQGEPVVASQIMRAAKGILAGRGNGIEGLRHAVAIIGLRRVQQILETIERNISEKPASTL